MFGSRMTTTTMRHYFYITFYCGRFFNLPDASSLWHQLSRQHKCAETFLQHIKHTTETQVELATEADARTHTQHYKYRLCGQTKLSLSSPWQQLPTVTQLRQKIMRDRHPRMFVVRCQGDKITTNNLLFLEYFQNSHSEKALIITSASRVKLHLSDGRTKSVHCHNVRASILWGGGRTNCDASKKF